jgi:lipoate-protein ligase A
MNWRLIQHGASSGAWNMAIDEALLEGARESSVPVMRFYSWDPACISLGRLQKVPGVVGKSTFDWVRRPTGGRAVLHQHEVTYCAVIPESYLAKENRSVIGSYNWLSQGFIAGLETLDIHAKLAPAHRGRQTADNCFSAPAQCDFVVDGRKLIGAAQCRKYGIILQHGSILMHIDAQSWQTALEGSMHDAVSLEELGLRVDKSRIAKALVNGLQQRWNVNFEASELTEYENMMASQLHHIKYSQAGWNHQGKEYVTENFGRGR